MKLSQTFVLCFTVAVNFKCTEAVPLPKPSYGYPNENPYGLYQLIQSYLNPQQKVQNPFDYYYNPYSNYNNLNNFGFYNPYASQMNYDYLPYSGLSQYNVPNFEDQYNPNYRSLDTDVQNAGSSSSSASEAESAVDPTATKK
ncbi:hypothetical protein FQR65_LT09856 [Abscondita terminalis]|nr:hypothetical protein FQR65_LT09856 [Abscondita terminalis]